MKKKIKERKEALIEKHNLNVSKSLEEAIKLLPEITKIKFTASVDLDIVLNVKEKQKKESVRGSVDLPFTFGSDKKIVVFCDEKEAKDAKAAGAAEAGLDDLKKKLLENKVEFDVVLATPAVMPKIIELGKVLGPKGLMPNPKNGTVITDVKKGVESFKSGKIGYKMEQGQGVIRGRVAKVDMKPEEIKANVIEYIKVVFGEAKKLASSPFKKITLSTSMSPGIKLDINDIIKNL